MKIKDAVYRKQMVEQMIEVEPEEYGCDECAKHLPDYPNETTRLHLSVFYKDRDRTDDLHFCSWKCCLGHLPKIKTDYFIAFPHVIFDESSNERTGFELIQLLKKLHL